MRVAKLAAVITGLCLMTGLVIYGGMFLWPRLAGSDPLTQATSSNTLLYLYSIGGPTGPTRPNAVTVYKGRVYVTDAGTHKVHVYALNGRKLFDFGKPGRGKTDFGFPNGIIVTGDGNLMISDSVNNDIKLFSPKGKYLKTITSFGSKAKPGYMQKNGDRVYVSDLLNNKILVIDEKGKAITTIADANHPLSYPQGTAIDKNGRLWVADGGHYAVKIFDRDGKFVTELNGGGNPKTPFSLVRGIAFDRFDRVYIADTIAHQIRIMDKDGNQLYVFPTSRQGEQDLVLPTNMFVDSGGKMFVVDRGTAKIKVYFIEQ